VSTTLDVSIGISAGEPVTDESDDLFGAAVQLAARLCSAAAPGSIIVSVAVRELCIGRPFDFLDNGRLELKGLPEPTQTYAVNLNGTELSEAPPRRQGSNFTTHPKHCVERWRAD
jgi:class 3 adenylate cyclase